MDDVLRVGTVEAGPGQKQFGYLTVVERPVTNVVMPVGIINSGRPGPRVVISAGIHGSEYPGIEAANRLWRSLTPDSINGVVVMFPLVNVPGFEAAEPNVNPLDHINLNRIFPGDSNGSPSMVMANRLVEEVSRVAEYVVDLHGGDITEWLDPFAIWFRSGDDAVDRKSQRLAELYDTRHIWITSGKYGYPGTFSGELARRRIPSVVCEAGFMGTYREDEIDQHVRGVTNILKGIGTLAGEPESVLEAPPRVFEENFTVATTRGGTMHPKVFPSEAIQKGQVLAEIKNLEGDVVEELVAPADGVVRVLFPKRVVGT
ncbi:MAG: succinylglutamate desuccinylase/aspartoacylase family protein, partial [Thermomicrobiales bacterium]